MTRVTVVGGGVAGVAAAVAAAQTGVQVTLYERATHLGGVAVSAGHRTLCGLAPIDAATPELLEPSLTGAWLPRLATGAPERRGRVWLWPTAPEVLAAGLAAGAAAAGVEVRLETAAPGAPDGPLIDASGAAWGRSATRAAAQWGAWRAEIALALPAGPSGRVAALRRLAGLTPGAVALEPLGPGRWQLTVDLPPHTPAASIAQQVLAALGARLDGPAVVVARDEGGHSGATLAECFATSERGLCWAAWPGEFHGPAGITWTWPTGARHGVPVSVARPDGAPAHWWCCGRGLAVSSDAAAALRVTGTALALGAAIGTLAAAS